MVEIRKVSKLVKSLLAEDEHCRNSDSYLYLRVLKIFAEKRGIDLRDVTISNFFLNLHGTAFPIFESVRRARQKAQEKNPDLRACDEVEEYRAENELEYRAYARGEV